MSDAVNNGTASRCSAAVLLSASFAPQHIRLSSAHHSLIIPSPSTSLSICLHTCISVALTSPCNLQLPTLPNSSTAILSSIPLSLHPPSDFFPSSLSSFFPHLRLAIASSYLSSPTTATISPSPYHHPCRGAIVLSNADI
ncbi:hypothetical protein BDW60DRAFT_130672 [Aspergillus nidulans var. acristatus]